MGLASSSTTLSRASSALMMVASGTVGLEVLATLSSSGATLPFFLRPRPEVDEGALGALVVLRGLALRLLRLEGGGTSGSDLGVTGAMAEAAGVSESPEVVFVADEVRLSLGLSGAASMSALM